MGISELALIIQLISPYKISCISAIAIARDIKGIYKPPRLQLTSPYKICCNNGSSEIPVLSLAIADFTALKTIIQLILEGKITCIWDSFEIPSLSLIRVIWEE